MKTFLSITLLLLMSSTLVSCSGGKTTAKLEISRGFAVNGGQFDGGLVVHGFSNSGKKVTLSIQGSYQKSFSLDADTWTFYVVGWFGPNKFAGATYCGQSLPQDISANPTVAINVSTANCNATFSSTTGLRDTGAIACSTFYKYNLSSNSWSNIIFSDPNDICTTAINKAQLGFGTDGYNYKLIAVDHLDGVSTPVFESGCLNADGVALGKLPNKLFPFVIKGYPSANDCVNNTKVQTFSFNQGLDALGSDFKHMNQVSGSFPSINSRIVLPSSITRTGYSTFRNQIPSILCGTSPSGFSECLTDINDGVDVYVPWSDPSWDDLSIKRKTTLSSCPPNLLDSSNKFSLVPGSCFIHKGSIRGKVYKNKLVCQASGEFTNIIATDRVGEKIFILKDTGATDTVEIYNDRGLLLFSFATSYNNNSLIAASKTDANQFKIVVYQPSGPQGEAFTWDTTSGLTGQNSVSLPSFVESIEADDNSIIYSVGHQIGIRTFDDTNLQSLTTYETFLITNLHVLAGRLYYIHNGGIVYKTWTQPSTIGQGGTLSGFATKLAVSESPTPVIYALNGTGQINARDPDDNSLFTSNSIYGGATDLEAKDGKVFVVTSGHLKVYDEANNAQLTTTSGSCNDTIVLDSSSIVFESRKTEHYNLHASSMGMIGRKYTANPNKLANAFREMSDDHDGKYSQGGALRRVQQQLSPMSIGGVLPQFADCGTLKNSGLLPMTGAKVVKDYDQDQNYNIVYTISQSATDLPLFTCADSDSTPGTCGGLDYDLDINYEMSYGVGINQKGLIRLSCGSKRGYFETLEIEGTKKSQELIVWNTQDHQNARVEAFEYNYKSATNINASITKISKDNADNTLHTRQVKAGQNSFGIYADATELHRVGSTILYKSNNINPSSWSASAFTMAPATDADFATQPASSSINNMISSVFAADVGGSFSAIPPFSVTQTVDPVNSFAMPMSMSAFENLDQPTSDLFPFFTLNP